MFTPFFVSKRLPDVKLKVTQSVLWMRGFSQQPCVTKGNEVLSN